MPSFEPVFDGYKLSLPAFTMAVLSASRWFTQYWNVVAVASLPALTVEWMVLALLGLSAATRWAVRPWCAGVTAVLLLVHVFIAVGVVLPLLKLLGELAR